MSENTKKLTHTIFVPETPEMQEDINAILSHEGVEYVDMKVVAQHEGGCEPFCRGGVWIVYKQPADGKPLI